MKSFVAMLMLGVLMMTSVASIEGRPGVLPIHQELFYTLPSAHQQTTVVRDALGNQGTAYAYHTQNGISSSSVAVSRSDNSKTLAYVPSVLAADPGIYAHHGHLQYQPSVAVASGVPVHHHHHPAVAYADYGQQYVV